jgi:branched-subunit amino acid aminotransferase/4-amino-4-deoxychorismate lyase
LNGDYVPAWQAAISVSDAGFVQGTTVAEQLRTFGGKLFRLEAHVERLFRSLAIVEVNPRLTKNQLAQIASELVAHNHALLTAGDDLGLAMLITPGEHLPMVPAKSAKPRGPTVCLHTFPLRFDLWAHKYHEGESLATTDVEQVSAGCWPPALKCRSRMHYYLADRQAAARHVGSRALMLDGDGFVTETTTSNIVLYRHDTGLLLPPAEKVLSGISLATLATLAEQLGIARTQRDLAPADVLAADEVFVTSTSPCMLSVVRLNSQPIGTGAPGPMFARFLSAWSDVVGLSIADQAARFASR